MVEKTLFHSTMQGRGHKLKEKALMETTKACLSIITKPHKYYIFQFKCCIAQPRIYSTACWKHQLVVFFLTFILMVVCSLYHCFLFCFGFSENYKKKAFLMQRLEPVIHACVSSLTTWIHSLNIDVEIALQGSH